MAFVSDKQEGWSRFALQLTVVSIAMAALLGLLHGALENPALHNSSKWIMWVTWCSDFRYLFEQLIFTGSILLVGAKFFETRTIFTVGFDKTDAAKISMKGPDEDNIVWIGHKYGSRLEAETVAATIESRLKSDAA
ncbi:MAG TPA: hypothetical protein VHZ29_13390 [Rhizomicrobium sp.]|jgi:hypothetical protein|nr:hypothetical protein [Rhizomicrobium sp.]